MRAFYFKGTRPTITFAVRKKFSHSKILIEQTNPKQTNKQTKL